MKILELMCLEEAISKLKLKLTTGDLLDKAIAGEIVLYAPVLDEGSYEWKVSLREGSSRTRGRAFIAFFDMTDGVALPVYEAESIKIRNWAVLNEFVCPSKVIVEIDSWKTRVKRSNAENVNYELAYTKSGKYLRQERAFSDSLITDENEIIYEPNRRGKKGNSNSTEGSSHNSIDDIYNRMTACAEIIPWMKSKMGEAIDSFLGGAHGNTIGKDKNAGFRITIDMLRISANDSERLKSLETQKKNDIPEIGENWLDDEYISDRLKDLIRLANMWKGIYEKGKDASFHRNFHEKMILSKIKKMPNFKYRSELAKAAAALIRPIYARRSRPVLKEELFGSHHSPELRALYRVATLPPRISPDFEVEIEAAMSLMEIPVTNYLLDHGAKVLQLLEHDTGRETQGKKKSTRTKK